MHHVQLSPEAIVKEVEPLGRVNTQESGYILVVGQRGGQSHQPHILLGGLYVTNSPEQIVDNEVKTRIYTQLSTCNKLYNLTSHPFLYI